MRTVLLAVALFGAWACGVNSATHHWKDAVGEAAWVGLALFVRRYWVELREAFSYLRPKR